jgi:hypothetical protein
MELKSVVITPDGKQFATKKEALEYLRRPKIVAALKPIVDGNEKLSDWLVENQDQVEAAFEAGVIRRVTKVERNKLSKALDAVKELANPKLAFITEHSAEILESFRWPSVTRMSDEEKAQAAKNSLVAATDGNEELANWIIAKKDAILEAYNAGKEKREINSKATEALAAWRAKKAAEKAAAEANAPVAGPGQAKAA